MESGSINFSNSATDRKNISTNELQTTSYEHMHKIENKKRNVSISVQVAVLLAALSPSLQGSEAV
jgi:hypothetical protein